VENNEYLTSTVPLIDYKLAIKKKNFVLILSRHNCWSFAKSDKTN